MSAVAFVAALRAEYIDGVEAAVGDYFDKHGDNADFEKIEDEVRDAGNKKQKIDAIERRLCPPAAAAGKGPSAPSAGPGGSKPAKPATQSVGKPSQPASGGSQKGSPAAAAFVAALRAEYVDGAEGSVGDYFDKHGENADFDRMEEEVRNSGDPSNTIDDIARRLGVQAAKPGSSAQSASKPSKPAGNKVHPEPAADAPHAKFDFAGWCNSNSCLSKLVRKGRTDAVDQLMELYSKNEELDKQYKMYEYELLRGRRDARGMKVEIEDTNPEGEFKYEGVVQDKEKALKRLEEFRFFFYGGFLIWFFIIVAFLINLAIVDCTEDAGLGEILIPIVTVLPGTVWLIFANNRLLSLQSKTTFEGVPLVRMMLTGGCFDSPRLNTIFSISDLYGKITRALFIGRVVRCSGEDFESGISTLNGMFSGWVRSESSGSTKGGSLTLVALIFFFVPFIMQNVRMVRSFCSIGSKVAAIKHATREDNMMIHESLDDHGAIADWALLKAPANVFFYAAVPCYLEDEHDAHRIWDLFKTRAIVQAANLIPDSVVQLWLMTIYFDITSPYMEFYPKLQLVLSMLSTSILAIIAGVFLIMENFVLSFSIGVLICFFSFLPIVWIIGGLTCGEGTFFSLGFQCVSV